MEEVSFKNWNDLQKFSKRWENEFPNFPPMWSFLDFIVSFYSKRPLIDLIKFDEYLQRHYCQYKNREISLKSFLVEKFGEKAAKLIEEMI